MCVQTKLKIQKVYGNKAIMDDGREVILGPVKDVLIGDELMVYANLALEKVINKEREKNEK